MAAPRSDRPRRELARVVVQPSFPVRPPFLPADPLLVVLDDGTVLRRSERPARPDPLLHLLLEGRLSDTRLAELRRIRVTRPRPDPAAGPPVSAELAAPHRPRTTLSLARSAGVEGGEWVVDPAARPADRGDGRSPADVVALLCVWTDGIARVGTPWSPGRIRVAAAAAAPSVEAVPWPLPGDLSVAAVEPIVVEAADIASRLEPLSARTRVMAAGNCFAVAVRHVVE